MPRAAAAPRSPRALLFLACAAAAAAPPPAFFVSPAGSDAGAGTLAAPFRTPARGAAALRAACGGGGGCAAGATLTLRGGDYEVDSAAPLSLAGVRGGGGGGARVVVRGYPGDAPPRLLGTRRVPLARPAASDAPALARLAPSAAARVLVGSLPPGADAAAGELYVGDAPQVLARWPDAPVARAFALRDAAVVARAAASCVAPADEPYLCAGWARTRAADNWTWGSVRASASAPFAAWRPPFTLRGPFTYDWAEAASTVAACAPAGGDGTLNFTRATWSAAGYWGGARYFAEGAPEALDEPGEYWVDAPTARVFWLPPEGAAAVAAASGAWSVAQTLLSVGAGAEHVLIEGIAFVGAAGAALTVAASRDVEVAQCAFFGAGVRAVDAHDAANAGVALRANFVAGTGADGLWVTGGNASLLEPSGARVEDNLVLNFGRRTLAFNPAVGIDGVGTVLARNLAASGPACGLMFSGAGQVVEHNVVADALRATFDMGVLCTGPRDWTQAGVAIRGNALLRNGFTPLLANHVTDPLRVGLYYDYGNNAHASTGNVVWQEPHPATPAPAAVPRAAATRAWAAYNHGGRNARVADSLFIGIAGAQSNGGSLEGGDAAALTNGSHYFAALAFCRAPPRAAACAALPGVAALAPGAPAGGAAACAAAAASCGAAPFNCSVEGNLLALAPPGAAAAQGNAEGVPFAARGNAVSAGAEWLAAGAGFARTLDFALAEGAPGAQPPQGAWGPRWLRAGAWRDVLWAAAPWAVGEGPAPARLDVREALWWLRAAQPGAEAPLALAARAGADGDSGAPLQ